MRTAWRPMMVLALLVAMPAVVLASTGLRSVMHGWKSSATTMHEMLTGQAAYDEQRIRVTLEAYAAEAGRIAGGLSADGGSAQEFRRRFVAFGAAAHTALDDLGHRPALAADFAHLTADCQSCHDTFDN